VRMLASTMQEAIDTLTGQDCVRRLDQLC